MRAGFEEGLELGDAIFGGVFDFLVGVEGRGVGGDVERVGAVEIGGAERDGRGVFHFDVEMGGGGQDAVGAWGVGYCVADDFADVDAAGLVDEEHLGVMSCVVRAWR